MAPAMGLLPGSGYAYSANDGLPVRLRRAFYDLRTEFPGAGREAAAVGAGVFIGCTPLFGFHLLICWAVGFLLRLNRLQMYVAANISNPVIAPLLVFSEIQTGAVVRRGEFHGLTLETLRTIDVWSFGLDYVIGSVVVGAVLGGMAAAATYAALRGPANDPVFASLIQRAAAPYVSASVTAWEFARGKLRSDPIYRTALCGDLFPSGRVLVDVGCGQGLMLALLIEARREAAAPAFRAWCPSLPHFERLVGIEHRPRVARLARNVLGAHAEILEADARSMTPESCSVVLLFDVLHMMSAADQASLMRALAAALEPGGVILVRDADASAGWRFAAVWAANRLKALVSGGWRQEFHFRSTREWLEWFDRLGLAADVQPMGEGTPFANVLFRVTVRQATASGRTPRQNTPSALASAAGS